MGGSATSCFAANPAMGVHGGAALQDFCGSDKASGYGKLVMPILRKQMRLKGNSLVIEITFATMTLD